MRIIVGTLVLFALAAVTVAAQQTPSLSFLSPPEGATVLTDSVTVSWTSEGVEIRAADGQHEEGVGHYHLFVLPEPNAQLRLEPGRPIGGEAIHTTATSYTLEKLQEGSYTLYLVLADGAHVPFDPPVVAVLHFTVLRPEASAPAGRSWLLVAIGALALLAAALWLTAQRAG